MSVSYIPHLNALRTFVVAAGHLNFTKAGAELNVSASAVSHQMRQLEDYFGMRLFQREAGKLKLTDEGRFLFDRLDLPFQDISRAAEQMRAMHSRKSVNLMCRPFFSSFWLAPRLSGLWARHPNLELNLIHKAQIAHSELALVDLAVIWSREEVSGLHGHRLIDGILTPVMSRSLAEKQGIPNSPADLERYVLLHEDNHTNWSSWLETAGVPNLKPAGSLRVDDTNVRLQHVLAGQGIMLSDPYLLAGMIADGTLIRPFDQFLSGYSYSLVWPSNRQPDKRTQTVINWLLEESAKSRAAQTAP